MPKLLLVGPAWPLRGGIARATTALAGELSVRGHLDAFLVPRRQYPHLFYPGTGDQDGAACTRLAIAQACFGVLEPWSWPGLAKRVRHARADAVVLPYWTAAWAPVARLVLGAARAPVVAVVHNPFDHGAHWVARRAARSVLRRCRGFLCHAESVKRELQAAYSGRPVAVHALPPVRVATADRAAARRRLGLAPDVLALLFFGLIRPYKGVEVLLEAVARLPREAGVVLVLVGEPWGGSAAAVGERMQKPDLAGRVIARLGWVPEGDVGDYFAAADAAVLPYRDATGSAVVAQALAAGLPVVASAVGGLAETVCDGENGLLVPAGDAAALAAALARLADVALRARLSLGARSWAERCTWTSYVDMLEALVARTSAGA